MQRKLPPLVPLFLCLLMAVSSCSEIPENDDPVIGIWSRTEIAQEPAQKVTLREEWIFNDVYLGRYQRYEGSQITFKSDFSWEFSQGFYHIEYPGTDLPSDVVKIVLREGSELLEDHQGEILATRE
ncbi:hypothetical protein OZ410_07765 [Robiginitalea sp. M366]|uniref:hypothetical protein n=1 Tax=Robiginitalea aestuariiviva TaxID=3036903 RepID=UPI00240DFA05|nr:hypothetical protein [Robiginitalea aestuariiviva]MDG1572209.1 hypothetical protein [Robiginitalea aestuariiviva]